MRVAVLTLLASIVCLSGCTGCPDPVVVGGELNRERCPTCFKSQRDNPLLQGTLTLEITNGPGGPFVEAAERNPLGFLYKNLRVDAQVQGNDPRGATQLDLIPEPRLHGLWESTGTKAGSTLAWDTAGIELGYALSEARVLRRGALGGTNQSQAPQSPIKVELASNVMLVPIQVVRVMPQSPSAPFAWHLAKFTKAVQKKYWDQRLDIETVRFPEPGVPNKYVEHSVNATSLPWTVADEIWAQCGIQFRMITCPGSNEGCPDLVVTDNTRIAAVSCPGQFSAPETQGNWDDAANLPGVRRDLPIVTFNWRVTAAGCQQAAHAKRGRAAMGFGVAAESSELTLAHELGHVLGLEDFSDCTGDGKHLMCNVPGEDSPKIRPEDCAKARTVAADFVKLQWDVTVKP